MPVVARISSIWSKQKLLVALFFLAFSGWFVLDGAVTWPKSNLRYDTYHWFVDQKQEDQWPAFAQSKGWVLEAPEKRHTDNEILAQFAFAGLLATAGIILFVYWVTQRKRMLKMEDGAVYTPTGARVPFSSIRGLGKKRWESKGIAIVRYEDNGRLLQFVVDDYKYEAEPTRQIVDVIEQHLTAQNDTAA